MTRPSPVVAVYGGSFDPPHIGHELVASYVLGAYDIERLLIIPTSAHAFGKPLSPFGHRFQMCKLAFSNLNRIHISDIESRIGNVSRTLTTLHALAKECPKVQLRLVIGSDVISTLSQWHGAEEIISLAPPIVVQRTGHITEPEHPAMPAISSSHLRKALHDGKTTEGLLNPRVLKYIQSSQLYSGQQSCR